MLGWSSKSCRTFVYLNKREMDFEDIKMQMMDMGVEADFVAWYNIDIKKRAI